MANVDLTVNLGKLVLDNPVIAASGTFGYGLEYLDFLDLNELGGFSTKGISLKPKAGNPVPRVTETASGMLNAIGLENIGLEEFLSTKLPQLKIYKTKIIVNFFGDTISEYVETLFLLHVFSWTCILFLHMHLKLKLSSHFFEEVDLTHKIFP